MKPALLLILLLLSLPLAAQERILAYHSDIAIQADGSMEVSETITVRAEGQRIRRGLYRDFPTTYRDRYGNRVRVAFEPIEVLRDGRPEPWFTETLGNGVRLNTGDDSFLPVPADITFTLRYRTSRQLGFFDAHDELYWNVNGLGWEFAIERLSAEVRLPQAVPAEQLGAEAYTGPEGAQGQDYRATVFAGGARYEATRPFSAGEGLTLVLSFPKGIVPEPTPEQRVRWLLQDNAGILIAGAGLLLLLVFYGWRWRRYGKDPEPGSIFPHYEPPPGESPAGLRYLRRMGYDSRCFAADIIEMAVRGYLTIERDKGLFKDSWSLARTPAADAIALSESQRAIAGKLFSRGNRIELKDSNAESIGGARNAHALALAKRYQPRHFVSNAGTVVLGFLFSLGYGVLAFVVSEGSGLIGIFVLLGLALTAHIVFGRLMYAPTAEGRKLLDRVEGLRLYLGVAERDELKSLAGPGAAAPALDAARYEALLPFAVALDVEEAWTAKFTAAVGAAAAATAAGNIAWYHGSGNIGDLGRFSSDLGSTLSSAISSSASPPGSSSGSGGGGSSGGGGGGGGGGGR